MKVSQVISLSLLILAKNALSTVKEAHLLPKRDKKRGVTHTSSPAPSALNMKGTTPCKGTDHQGCHLLPACTDHWRTGDGENFQGIHPQGAQCPLHQELISIRGRQRGGWSPRGLANRISQSRPRTKGRREAERKINNFWLL